MQAQDNAFFEEYKRLDRLCGDMYSCQNGVSTYIAEMEQKANQGRYRVSSWNADYKMLKHVRWVRNQIAHDTGTYRHSEPADLESVKSFYRRILSGQDPLTLLRRAAEAQRKTAQKKAAPRQREREALYRPQPPVFVQPAKKAKRSGKGALVLIALGLALLLLALYLKFPAYF